MCGLGRDARCGAVGLDDRSVAGIEIPEIAFLGATNTVSQSTRHPSVGGCDRVPRMGFAVREDHGLRRLRARRRTNSS